VLQEDEPVIASSLVVADLDARFEGRGKVEGLNTGEVEKALSEAREDLGFGKDTELGEGVDDLVDMEAIPGVGAVSPFGETDLFEGSRNLVNERPVHPVERRTHSDIPCGGPTLANRGMGEASWAGPVFWLNGHLAGGLVEFDESPQLGRGSNDSKGGSLRARENPPGLLGFRKPLFNEVRDRVAFEGVRAWADALPTGGRACFTCGSSEVLMADS
jgi:hypothetical protein